MKKILYTIWEIAEVFLVALIAVAAIKYFLIQPFIVNGASMEPNFSSGDYLLIDELSYRFREPQRGDVVVFKSPQDPSVYFIKRIIGLPKETVEVNGNIIKINGKVLKEPYLSNSISSEWSGTYGPKTLGDDQYFVVGDNRMNSFDSRYWGPLSRKAIIGLVKLRLWPVSQIQFFKSINYSEFATSTSARAAN